MRIVIDTEPLTDGPPPTDLHLMVPGLARNGVGVMTRTVETLHRSDTIDRRELRETLLAAFCEN